MDKRYFITEDGPLSHFSMIPHIIDDMALSPSAVRLYLRLKRRVRQNTDGTTTGTAFESVKSLSAGCNMSAGQITKAKRELVAAGLIEITKVPSQHGEWPADHINIVNIWPANSAYYSDEFTITRPNGDNLTGEAARKSVQERENLRAQIPDFIRDTRPRS